MNNYKDTFDFIHIVLSLQTPFFEKGDFRKLEDLSLGIKAKVLEMYSYADDHYELVNKQLLLFKDKVELHYLKDHERKYIILSDSGLTKGDE